jgi:hypothetical protein
VLQLRRGARSVDLSHPAAPKDYFEIGKEIKNSLRSKLFLGFELQPKTTQKVLETANCGFWEREWTATLAMAFAVRFHTISCSLRETTEILGLFGVERSHQAIFQWYIAYLMGVVCDCDCCFAQRCLLIELSHRHNWDL